ncbi:hypothetical protein [Urbifossiella limnaea]|uniref:Uncharacterized protein n=1 Tax=Urbifossiella limnaea TaxID=2528023 RepID=A0A517XWK9_9BACT|nr:hypothetical protein [Urbifossiella limnaea]QDU21885.1 hypothetical protein ETAA1_38580 [Urbifossiella limnaea]
MCPPDPATPDAVRGLDDLPTGTVEAVLRTLPRRAGEREHRLLYLARSLLDLAPDAPAAYWAAAVRFRWTRAAPVICTPEWGATWRAFVRAWGRCDVSVSASRPLALMAEAAAAAGGSPADRLRAACEAMARATPDGQFHLSCRMAGQVAGVSKTTAARLLAGLNEAGFLALVVPGTRGAESRRAAVYRLDRASLAAFRQT